jgi:hypothetical protein
MQRETITKNYNPETNKLSNLNFEGEGMINFWFSDLIIENCDLSLFSHISFDNICSVEILGLMTLENVQEIEQFKTTNLNCLTINVDQNTEVVISTLFQMFTLFYHRG